MVDAVTAMADALLVSGLSAFSFSAAAVAAAIALSEDADAATTVYLATTAADVDAAATNPYVEDTFLNIPDIY